jgi:RND superfamily putative drug exporter
VTSAALVLMFAFFVLSTSPGTDIKQFGIGLAAGIIFDATVIRALLVPALVTLMAAGTGGCRPGRLGRSARAPVRPRLKPLSSRRHKRRPADPCL